MQNIKINFLHKLKDNKYYLLFSFIVSIAIYNSILLNNSSFNYTIQGTKDLKIHTAIYVARYDATNESGFNCKTFGISDAGPRLKMSVKYHTINDDKYNINIPYELPFYEDLSIGCEFKLSQIQLVLQQNDEHDYVYAYDSNDEQNAIKIFRNYSWSDNGVEKAGWGNNIKNLKKYFKIPPKTKLYCHTESSELLCELEAPKSDYTYHYELQNKKKVVSYITHPDIGTDTINRKEFFNIDILMDPAVPYSECEIK